MSDPVNSSDEAIDALVEAWLMEQHQCIRVAFDNAGVSETTTWDQLSERTKRIRRNQARPMVEFIAAAVRAEAVAERAEIIEAVRDAGMADALPFNALPDIVRGIGRQRDWQRELRDHLANAARRVADERDKAIAEAVAEERQRIERVLSICTDQDGDEYAHTHRRGEGEPTCPACWVLDIRSALAAGPAPVATPEPEATLRDVWGKVHVARGAHQSGETAVPDSFYAGVIHSERIIEQALGFRPGSMASDPREQSRVAADACWIPPGVSTCANCWHDGTSDEMCPQHQAELDAHTVAIPPAEPAPPIDRAWRHPTTCIHGHPRAHNDGGITNGCPGPEKGEPNG